MIHFNIISSDTDDDEDDEGEELNGKVISLVDEVDSGECCAG